MFSGMKFSILLLICMQECKGNQRVMGDNESTSRRLPPIRTEQDNYYSDIPAAQRPDLPSVPSRPTKRPNNLQTTEQYNYNYDYSDIPAAQKPELPSVPSRPTEPPNNFQTTFAQMQDDTRAWTESFAFRINAFIDHLTTIPHQQIENSLKATAEDHIKRDLAQRGKCPNSIVALGLLFKKLKGEIDTMNATLHPGGYNGRGNRGSIPHIPPPSSTLATIKKLGHRLYGFGVELETEREDNCSRHLFWSRDDMAREIVTLQTTEQERYRVDTVRDSVEAIVNGRLDWVKEQLAQIKQFGGTDLDVQSALQEIIDKTLSAYNSTRNFPNLVNLLKKLPQEESKNGTAFLIQTMKTKEQMDSMQFLILAHESKNAFGTDLKNHFPLNLQRLIWGGTYCLRNRVTGRYLVRLQTQQRAQVNNLRIGTYEIPRNDSTNPKPRQEIAEFCGWEFFPMVDGNSLVFIIRKTIDGDSEWNLNVADNLIVQVSPAAVHSHFIWKIIPQDQAQSLSFYSLHPNIQAGRYRDRETLCGTFFEGVHIGSLSASSCNGKWEIQDKKSFVQ